jgi:hypothetical protein
MNVYIRNRACSCQRCRIRGLMGAGLLITLGFLFLLQNYRIVNFDKSFPVILIIIGLFLFAKHNASVEGHVQPFGLPGSTPPDSGKQNNSQVTS